MCHLTLHYHNTGKHNVHFDPYESTEHTAVIQLLESVNLTALLSTHTGKTCTVRETGLSLTKPNTLSNEEKSIGEKNISGEDCNIYSL